MRLHIHCLVQHVMLATHGADFDIWLDACINKALLSRVSATNIRTLDPLSRRGLGCSGTTGCLNRYWEHAGFGGRSNSVPLFEPGRPRHGRDWLPSLLFEPHATPELPLLHMQPPLHHGFVFNAQTVRPPNPFKRSAQRHINTEPLDVEWLPPLPPNDAQDFDLPMVKHSTLKTQRTVAC